MDKKDDHKPSTLWDRRSRDKLNLTTNKPERPDSREHHESPSLKRYGGQSSHSNRNPFNSLGAISTATASSPATGASSAFGLGSGAFASFGSASKTPKTPGTAFDFSRTSAEKREPSDYKEDKRPLPRKSLSSLRAPGQAETSPKDNVSSWPLRYPWVIYYRPPTSKNSDYEKSIRPLCKVSTAQEFWKVYTHLKHPSTLPTVSDYHFFREGIRPVWEDEENKRGGKWIMRLKKGVADRYWEDLLLALVGDQFAEAGEEVCGAVVSVRSGEDVFSIWTKNDGGRNIKIRETIKRVLNLPLDTMLQWRSHDDSITQRVAADQARQENQQLHGEKRRNTLVGQKDDDSKA
ncbi:hypothetical protein AMS68_007297 [Peltaster fructicola]|uniref:Translation initiation factor eIF4E3 n=1 Tax=Peltaster fructicola TaxID=286661 RepID=A0A6H0Y596_9PEZI|nr:hypothetical protein AMS68_007297 [Peltaster fructicola]